MRFFSPPEKPTLSARFSMSWSISSFFGRLAHALHELRRRQLVLAARLALRVQRRLEERHGGDAGDFDWILEGEEQALGGALVGLQFEDVLAVEQDLAFGDLIVLACRQ